MNLSSRHEGVKWNTMVCIQQSDPFSTKVSLRHYEQIFQLISLEVIKKKIHDQKSTTLHLINRVISLCSYTNPLSNGKLVN